MSDSSTAIIPGLPAFLPNPRGIPVAPFAMQKILTKAIRSHGTNQNLRSTAVKGADKMGGKRTGGKSSRSTARAAGTIKK